MFAGFNFKGDFLKQKITRQLFRQEQHLPSAIIDRGSIRAWNESGRPDTFERAKARVAELLGEYQRPPIQTEQEEELHAMVAYLAREAGMEDLPKL